VEINPGTGIADAHCDAPREALLDRIASLAGQLAAELIVHQRMAAEMRHIATVIERAGVPIQRGDREMHDWLAQVLQVLVSRMGIAEMERDTAYKTRDLAQAAANRALEAKRHAEHERDHWKDVSARLGKQLRALNPEVSRG
jgi:nitrate/nitrite-specific signal transduction histidine kinase